MICTGYNRTAHHVTRLHAKELCDGCYLKKYRDEHQTEIIKYQKAYQETYRADPAYKMTVRLYIREYRKTH